MLRRALPFGVLSLLLLAPLVYDRESVRPIDPAASALRPPLSTVTLLRLDTGDAEADGDRTLVVDELSRQGDGWSFLRRGETGTLSAEDLRDRRQRTYWLGTDRVGRDVLALLLHGARTSIAIGLLSAAVALLVGSAVGGLSGAGPRWADALLMRLLDALLAFPQLVLVLLLAVLFRPSPLAVVLIVGLTSWMGIARMVRAEVLQLRRSAFVLAARALGATHLRVVLRHLLPNTLGPALIAATLLVGDAILVESALSFLGLGSGGEAPTWGRLVAEGRGDLVRAWWISAFPGLAITGTVLLVHRCGSRIASWLDIADPHLRG